MGITWIAPSSTPALQGSSSVTAGLATAWMVGVEGEPLLPACIVITTHTEQISASVEVTCPEAATDSITVAPSPDGTGFMVSGTPNIWNSNNYTWTNGKLTKFEGSQPDRKEYTVTCNVTWNYMVGGIPQPPTTYTGIYKFIIMNRWQTEKASVIANV